MIDDEIRIVTRQETFTDLAVRELAKSKAKCICCLQFGRCKKGQCSSCQTNKEFYSCYTSMSSYDRSRLKSYINEYYVQYSFNPVAFMNHKQYKSHFTKFYAALFGGFLLVCALFGLLSFGPHDQLTDYNTATYEDISLQDYKYLVSMGNDLLSNVYDVDKDGKVDCCDYAILWYMANKVFYPSSTCELVRNYNPPTFNHLFVRWRSPFTKKWVVIEPHMYRQGDILLTDYWADKYDPRYNRYGETKKWVSSGVTED